MANETLKDLGCYTQNLGELLTDLSVSAALEGDKVVIDYTNVLQILQLLHDNIAETLQECEGKQLIFRIPNTFIAKTLVTTLKEITKLNFNYVVEGEEVPTV